MAISHDNLPRDENGIVQGAWRVLHENPEYNGQLGAAIIVNGESTFPIAGRPLALVAAHFGGELYIEPWGDAPQNGWMLPPCVSFEVPASIDWTPEPCPWRKAAPKAVAKPEPVAAPVVTPDPEPVAEVTPEPAPVAEPFDIDTAEPDALRAHCEANGIDYDGRWGARRLRREIRKHGS